MFSAHFIKVYRLLKTERVFYYTMEENKCLIAPMALSDDYKLIYNPDVLKKVDTKFWYIILAHEILHDLLDHLPRAKNIEETKEDRIISNLAADHVVNSILMQILHGADKTFIEHSGFYIKELLKKDVYFEQVFRMLKQNKQENIKVTILQDEKSIEIQKNNCKKKVALLPENLSRRDDERKGYPSTSNDKLASLGSSLLLREINIARNGVSLDQVLNKITTRYVDGFKDITFLKTRKKLLPLQSMFNVKIPTRSKTKEKPKIIYAVDTSGSISDGEFSTALATIKKNKHLISNESKVILFTTEIEEVINVADIYSKLQLKRYTGGTMYDNVFKFAEKEKTDLLVMLTDLYPYKWPARPKVKQFIFVTTERNVQPPYGKCFYYS